MVQHKIGIVFSTVAVLAITGGGFHTAAAQSGMVDVAHASHAGAGVLVDNQNEHEVEIYAITTDGDVEELLGLVSYGSSGSFTLPEVFTRGGRQFYLRINCMWPTDESSQTLTYHETVKTNSLTASPGGVIRVHVREPLRDTSLDAGQS